MMLQNAAFFNLKTLYDLLYLNGRDDHNSSRPRDTALSAPAARGHNVDLIGIVGVEIGHDVA